MEQRLTQIHIVKDALIPMLRFPARNIGHFLRIVEIVFLSIQNVMFLFRVICNEIIKKIRKGIINLKEILYSFLNNKSTAKNSAFGLFYTF